MRPINSFLLTLVFAATAAATPLNVTLNTAGLPAGDYLFDFQFINGDSVIGNNTATVSGLASVNLTSGALSLFGTATGASLVSGVTLTDGPITEVDQAFTVTATAASVSFTVDYTTNYAPPGPGDAFTFAITDTSLNSTRSAGDGAELEIDMTGPDPSVGAFAADADFGGFTPGVSSSTATPEMETAALSGSGIFILGLLARQRREVPSSKRSDRRALPAAAVNFS
jgi:hypothetical protein